MIKHISAKLYIPAILVIMTAGVFLMLKYGYRPVPTDILKPSFFDRPEEIGAVVYRRFYGLIQLEKRAVIGIAPVPAWNEQIVRGFMLAAKAEGHPFQAVIIEEQLPKIDFTDFPDLAVVTLPTNTDTQAELIDQLQAHSAQNTLLIMPSTFSSHLLAQSPLVRLERTLKTHFVAITVEPLALKPDQEYRVNPACLGSQRDVSNTADLGCMVLQSGRVYYPKHIAQNRWVAIMNEPRPEDYLLMVSEPGQDQNTADANRELRMAAPSAPVQSGAD